jgi:hypothetical protein
LRPGTSASCNLATQRTFTTCKIVFIRSFHHLETSESELELVALKNLHFNEFYKLSMPNKVKEDEGCSFL